MDFGRDIDWCRDNGVGAWLDAESATTLPLDAEVITRSVVVCSDVLEHLVNPRLAMRLICWLLDQGSMCAVLSIRHGTSVPEPITWDRPSFPHTSEFRALWPASR